MAGVSLLIYQWNYLLTLNEWLNYESGVNIISQYFLKIRNDHLFFTPSSNSRVNKGQLLQQPLEVAVWGWHGPPSLSVTRSVNITSSWGDQETAPAGREVISSQGNMELLPHFLWIY